MPDNTAVFDLLAGVRIVDFTQFEAGPSSTEALAWLGAEVVKIENPKMGDPGRRLRPGQPDNDPYYFHVFNANKKSITLNLKSPRGLDLVKDLLRKADVCVENYAPGTIERLGLGYDVVRDLNPRIIFAQVKGFGEVVLERAALAKTLHLGVDDARVEIAHHVVAETEPLDGAGRVVLHADVRLAQQVLHKIEAARRFQVERDRLLVGVEHVEVIGVVVRLAGAQAATGVAHF